MVPHRYCRVTMSYVLLWQQSTQSTLFCNFTQQRKETQSMGSSINEFLHDGNDIECPAKILSVYLSITCQLTSTVQVSVMSDCAGCNVKIMQEVVW